MISGVFITGEAGKIIDNRSRLIKVSRPIMDSNSRGYIVDSFLIRVKNSPATSSQIMKVPEGTLVMVKGRLETDFAANKVLQDNGVVGSCFVIVAELTECFTLSSGMKGYQEFFPEAKQ